LIAFKSVTIFLFLLLFAGCNNPPRIIIGVTYFNENNIRRSGADRLEALSSQSVVEARGVYESYFYAVKSYPALLSIDPQKELTYILLQDSLEMAPGDFIAVSGGVVDSALKAGITARKIKSMLKVQHASIIQPTHKFLSAAQRDYEKIYARISSQGPKNSRLIWPASPNWRLLVNERTNEAIVSFSAADLMYAVQVNFVYNMKSEKLFKVYVDEKFKGE